MAIKSNRNKLVPFHTTPDVLEALLAEEAKTKYCVSRSKIIHDIVVAGLRERGYDVKGYEYRKTS